uniref:A-kinase anchoring protein 13 n=1 Tax=Cyprinus carpio carpio TaxID=630221 RepID=A0A8C1E184_CYPCA
MKLNPQQAPLYGECLLTVQLCEEECVEDEEDVEFYLLFAGTTQRHISSTLKVSHVTLQAVCPAHDRSETVRVTLCQARPGGSVDPVAEEHFQFVQDLALDMAQFLVNAVGKTEGALLLDECQIPLKECERLDDTLALALRHLPLPAGWSVLGTDWDTGTCTGLRIEPGPQDTLLHFAAKRGLRKVALFLLQQPGGREALRLRNKQGRTPARVAQKKGHTQLQKLLTEVDKLPELETKTSKWRYPEGRVLRHHPKLNTYTLTLEDLPGSPPPSLQCDVEELQCLIQSHQKEDPPPQHKPALLILNPNSTDRTEPVDCLPVNSLEPEHQEPNSEKEETCESNSFAVEDGLCIHQNGTGDHVQSQDGEVELDPPAVGDIGKASDKADCSQKRVEGDSVTFSAPSCGNQREEADIELCVISAKQGAASQPDKGNQEEQEACQRSLQTEKDAKSGNLESQDMGQAQSQGLLPTETSQPSQREEESEGSADLSWRGDLPEEREGEMSSSQEIGLNSKALSSHDPEENGQHDEKFEPKLPTECSVGTDEAKLTLIQVNSEVTSSVRNDEALISDGVDKPHGSLETETGNLSEHTNVKAESVSGLVTDEVSIKQNSGLSISEGGPLELLSLQPNMAPGPVHKVRRGLSPVPETSHEGPAVEPLSETTEVFQQPHQVSQSSETALECQEILNDSDCDISAVAGVSVGIIAEVASCQIAGSLPDGSKEEETPNERINHPKEIFEEQESINDTVVSPLDDKSKSSDESSLPVDSEAFIVSDLQQDASTILSSEHCGVDIIKGTTFGGKDGSETFVQPDSTSNLVEQIPEGDSGDTTNENQICEPGEPLVLVSTLQGEPGFKDVAPDDTLQEREIDSTSQDTINKLLDLPEITHNDCPESNKQVQLPESSKESANTPSEPTAECVNDLDLSCGSPLTESQGSRPSETPFTDGVKISAVIPGGDECVDMATDMCETTVSGDSPCSPMVTSSGSALKSSSMSDPLNASSSTAELTSPLDINSGSHQDLEHTSPVDIDNGLSEELQPSETPESLNGLHQDTPDCLMNHSETLQQCAEEPHVEKMTDDSALAEDAVDGHQDSSVDIANSEVIHRETEKFYSVDASQDVGLQEKKSTSVISEFPPSTPSPETTHHKESASTMRGSASDDDSLFSQDLSEDSVFNNKAEDSVTLTSGVSMSYSSSTDDTSSLGTPSAISQASTEAPSSDPCEEKPTSPGASPVSGETEEEEKKDHLTEVLERPAILRTSIRSLSPLRRHSWGPGKNSAGETEISQRSYSLEGLAAEKEGRKSLNQCMREASQEPNCSSKLDREERGSLVSLTEEEQESDLGDFCSLDSQKSIHSGQRCVPHSQSFLTKSVSMLAISHKDLDAIGRPRPKRRISFSFSISPMLPKSKNLFSIGSSSSDEEEAVRLGSFTATSGSLENCISEEDPGPLRSDSEGKVGGTKVSRTFSYLKSKMSKKNKVGK